MNQQQQLPQQQHQQHQQYQLQQQQQQQQQHINSNVPITNSTVVITQMDFRSQQFEAQLDNSVREFGDHLYKLVTYNKLSDHNQTQTKLAEIAAMRQKLDNDTQSRLRQCQRQLDRVQKEVQGQQITLSLALEATHGVYLKQGVWREWIKYVKRRKNCKLKEMHVDDFLNRGLLQKSLRSWKKYAHLFGRQLLEERLEMNIENKINEEIQTAKGEQQLLEKMILEIQQQYKLELRKRNILKTQLDQAYLRGVSAISCQAMKMSQNNLNDVHTEFVETKNMHISQNFS